MNYILSSLESYEFETPRKAEYIKSVFVNEKEAWVIKVSPNVVGQKYGLKDEDINYLLISPRHAGVKLSDVTEFPCFVYIARLVDNRIPDHSILLTNEINVIAWGELYKTDIDNQFFN